MAQEVAIKWHGASVRKAVREAELRGITLWAEYVLTAANAIVPLDEGTLERSGRVIVNRRTVEAVVSYDTPYAVRQHEELDYRHAPGRTAKYLERPWLASRRVGLAIVAKQVRRVTR